MPDHLTSRISYCVNPAARPSGEKLLDIFVERECMVASYGFLTAAFNEKTLFEQEEEVKLQNAYWGGTEY